MPTIREMVLHLVLVSVLPAVAHAQMPPEPDCSTPRRAVVTWLGNLQPGEERTDAAVRCFDWRRAGVSGARRFALARELKQVLDVSGLYVDVDSLPDTRDLDETRVPLFSTNLPEVYLVERDDQWLISDSTIRAIPELHARIITVDVEAYVRTLPAWLRDRPLFGVAWWQFLALLLALASSFVVRTVIAWVVASWGGKVMARWGQAARAELVAKAATPIGTIAMAGVLWYALPMLRFGVQINQVAHVAIRVLAAVSAVFVLYRVVDVVADLFAKKAEKTHTKLDDQLVPLVRRSMKVIVVVIGVIFVLQNMDVDVTSLLAMGTVGTLAVSFAAKDIVANLFGSVSIFADRPFHVGDWVVIGDTEGVVEEVGMRSTRVRTFYNSLVTVPNSTITVTPVDNYGERKYRRCFTTLSLTYDTTPEQMQAFCDGLRAILKANPAVRKDYYEVHMSAFGTSSLDVMLYFFFEVDTWSAELRERHNVFLEVMRLAGALGVEFAFPTQTVHVDSLAVSTAKKPHAAPAEDDLEASVLAFAPGGTLARPAGPRITHGFFAGPSSRGAAHQEEDGA